MAAKIFSVATCTRQANGDDLWENKRITQAEAEHILISNGWKPEDATKNLGDILLDRTPWILVNNMTQIC